MRAEMERAAEDVPVPLRLRPRERLAVRADLPDVGAAVSEPSSPLSFSVAFGATTSEELSFASLMVERSMSMELERMSRPSATVVGPESAMFSS